MELFQGQHLVIGRLDVDQHRVVHDLQGLQDPHPLVLGIDGFFVFVLTHIGIVAHADDQDVTHRLAAFQQVEVPHMKNIEDTAGIADMILFLHG